MKEDKVLSLEAPAELDAKSPLEQLIAEGARKMLQAAIEQEIEEYLQAHRDRQTADGRGRASVVRNGHLPERQLITGVGPIPIHQPRVRHRDGQHFSSAILPKYLRRVPSVDALIPALYLKGVSTGDFSEALAAILGEKATGLSATNIVRLKASWEVEYQGWRQRDLAPKTLRLLVGGRHLLQCTAGGRAHLRAGGGRGFGGRHQGVAGHRRWVPRKQRVPGRTLGAPAHHQPH